MCPGALATRIRAAPKQGPCWAAPIAAAWVLLALICASLAWPHHAVAVGPNAVMTPAGYNTNVMPRGDDDSLRVNVPFTINWFGSNYSRVYINQNGSVTWGNAMGTPYNPTSALNSLNRDIIAVFFADIDTRVAAQITYSNTVTPPTVNGRNAFFVNWIGMGYYDSHATPTDSFQLVIVDRSDTGAGNVDLYFNYDQVLWDIADQSTTHARAGWSRQNGTSSYEFPGSGSTTSSPLLDGGPAATSLIRNCQNAQGQLGRYVFQVRGGTAPNLPPKVVVTNRTLEGNTAGGYTGYTGSGDATATDADGSVASFTNNLPGFLPLGVRSVLWTATDNRAAVTTATQSVTVTDTTPPANPSQSSSRTAGTWSTSPTLTVSWSGATDVCSGVNGYSYLWSIAATASPDTSRDTATSTVTTSVADGGWYWGLRTVDVAGNWSAPVFLGPFGVDRAPPATTDDAPAGWRSAAVNVGLAATDALSGVASTRYRLDGAALTTYTAPVAVSVEGVHALDYRSTDIAGNTETTRSATVRIDLTPPSVPSPVTASAVSTTSAEISWGASTDALSGMGWYRIFRDGALVATRPSAETSYTDAGLNPGQTYGYAIAAVDSAGNASSQSATATVRPPVEALWLTLSAAAVTFPSVTPGSLASVADATVVSVGGVGGLGYDLTCSAPDFDNLDAGSSTPTMPVGSLAFTTRGWATGAQRPLSNADQLVDSATGTQYAWQHDYVVDLSLDAPWTCEPGTYSTTITYTVVQR